MGSELKWIVGVMNDLKIDANFIKILELATFVNCRINKVYKRRGDFKSKSYMFVTIIANVKYILYFL